MGQILTFLRVVPFGYLRCLIKEQYLSRIENLLIATESQLSAPYVLLAEPLELRDLAFHSFCDLFFSGDSTTTVFRGWLSYSSEE